ncbi:MAG: phytanoyl-CoA dioxygenase family protein [bacterium]|nr:phytanoyl-CoA dioxygenase family protein [bacterium]
MDLNLQVDRLKKEGWCVVEGVIPDGEVSAVREQVAKATSKHGRSPAAERGIGHVPGFIAYDPSIAPYLANRKVMDLLEAVLGAFVRVSFTTATINYPGNQRGTWHADWPFNQRNAAHVPAPYPDVMMHVTTLWMLSPFSNENGGTLIVPGSHRKPNNPTGDIGVDPMASHPEEINATGSAGSVLVLDSRIWHATAPNQSDEARVSVVVRYAPWWLNTQVLRPGSEERKQMVDEPGLRENDQPLVPRKVYEGLPEGVKPLFRHWVQKEG